MKFLSKTIILSAALITLSGCNSSDSQADSSLPPVVLDAPAHTKDSVLYYLTATSIPVGTWLQAPFTAGSDDEQADLAAVLALQYSRTDADCARAKTEVNISLNSFFGPAYGPLSKQEVSELTPFFNKIENDADYAASQEKNFWKRPRPYLVDSAIQPCIKLETSYSYPSGHSTISHAAAAVLDLVFPDRKAQIDARADQIAEDRVMGGVHYPSDIAAGVLMSERVFQAIQESGDFEQDLKNAEALFTQ
jgi:acid phosphatase (class A)